MEIKRIQVDECSDGQRLDVFLTQAVPELSRTQAKNLICQNMVLVEGQARKPGFRVREGDSIEIRIPPVQKTKIVPQDIPLNIIYQDKDVVVIDKPQGMVVHPAHGNWERTMVNALLFHVKDLSGINGEIRPGIVHRLDKDTSGILVVAKNDSAHQSLAAQIKEKLARREYVALVHGVIKNDAGTIEAPIGRSLTGRKKMAVVGNGRPAVTHYRVLRRFNNYTLVRVRLETGRTHQIRVHFAYIGHPVVGDPVYGPSRPHFDLDGQALHSCYLCFQHPSSGEVMEFVSPLPGYFQKLLENLEKNVDRHHTVT